ncbi:hypothetical protein F5Y04DRAFT_289150 [Hypomontagnella monticulosa]|nr:hypothetical protein F5Y04DRAFT_289150 [Hypomontagnella monticulosa]
MAPIKRQKWLDEYDPATGQYTSHLVSGGSETKSPTKAQEKTPVKQTPVKQQTSQRLEAADIVSPVAMRSIEQHDKHDEHDETTSEKAARIRREMKDIRDRRASATFEQAVAKFEARRATQSSPVKGNDEMSHGSWNAPHEAVSSGYANSKHSSYDPPSDPPSQAHSSSAYGGDRSNDQHESSDREVGFQLHESDHDESTDGSHQNDQSIHPVVAGVTLYPEIEEPESEHGIASPQPSAKSGEPATEEEIRLWAASCSLISPEPKAKDYIDTPVSIRPAQSGDLGQITRLYNTEVEMSYKLKDKAPVSIVNFQKALSAAEINHLPFVVAVYDDGKHRDVDQVVGFALMDIATRGIAGSLITRGAHRGKLTVLVDIQYRGLNICTALLDNVLRFCSTVYIPRRGYEFTNPGNDQRYVPAPFNVRQWDSVDVEVVIKRLGHRDITTDGDEFSWIGKFLVGKFQMYFAGYEEKALKELTAEGVPQWYDIATFRHQCRDE